MIYNVQLTGVISKLDNHQRKQSTLIIGVQCLTRARLDNVCQWRTINWSFSLDTPWFPSLLKSKQHYMRIQYCWYCNAWQLSYHEIEYTMISKSSKLIQTGTHILVFSLSWIGKSIAAKRLLLSDFYLTVELRISPVCKTEEYRIPNKIGPFG